MELSFSKIGDVTDSAKPTKALTRRFKKSAAKGLASPSFGCQSCCRMPLRRRPI